MSISLRSPADSHQFWSAVFAMSLAAFALVASEFMPVSLLTPIATDLGISEGQAGQAISISGAFALLTSLFIATISEKIERKVLLLSLTLLMIASGTIVTLAPNYLVLMIGRAFIGIAIGGFWSLSAATAMQLVASVHVPRALAILNGGNALASVLAAPIGSFLGGIIGWRGAFFCVVPVAAIALVWMLTSLPQMPQNDKSSKVSVLKLIKSPAIAVGMLAVSVFFMGQFTLFTYLRPFLETVTKVNVSTLSLMLFIIGAAGFIGTIFIGRFINKGIYQTLATIPALMAIIAIVLILSGESLVSTTLLLGLWGLFATAAPVGWWTWMAKSLPNNAEAGGGLMVALIQLSITLGATVGGVLFDSNGYQVTFGTSAILLLLASGLAIFTAILTKNSKG
ncbi:MFS transporter [Shewanella sp.]|uniref:MFS transporter n=1 Tax=Shewanella sp. TaxID=50422 RepID=UPI003A971990